MKDKRERRPTSCLLGICNREGEPCGEPGSLPSVSWLQGPSVLLSPQGVLAKATFEAPSDLSFLMAVATSTQTGELAPALSPALTAPSPSLLWTEWLCTPQIHMLKP